MLRRLPSLLLLALLLPALAAAPLPASLSPPEGSPPDAGPIRFMRDPHVAGDLIAFSYQGDIWVARRDGSGARRLTNHIARDVAPRFSPDGRWVAFSSDRFGNYDVFLVPVEGGEPVQLTYHTGSDMVDGWTPDGRIIFATSRSTHPFFSPLYTVSPRGGIPLPMEMDQARNASVSPDGRYVAFNRRGLSTTRKGYKGSNATDIWIQDLQTGLITKLTDTDLQSFREHVHDALPMWGADGMIYFVSERDGIFNLWKIAPSGGAPVQVTRFGRGGVKYPAMGPGGRTIVFTQEHELWVVEVPGGEPRKITVSLAFDPSINRVEWVEAQNRAEGFRVAPDGKKLAVDFRGEIFQVPVEADRGEKAQLTSSPWRERYGKYSPDGRYLAYVSDEGAREELWVVEPATGERRRLTSHDSQKDGSHVWSPDSRKIALVAANTLFEVEVASARTAELAYNEAGGFSLGEYSPDGRWLLYARSDEELNSEVYLLEADSRREVNLTRNPFRDWDGALTPDGAHLVFRSNRDGGTPHLFAVPLARLLEDPDDPLVKGREAAAGSLTAPEAPGRGSGVPEASGRGAGAPAAPAPLQVEPEGIERRVRQLTRGSDAAGEYFLSADGQTVYFASRDNDGTGLFSVPLEGGERKRVAQGSFEGMRPTADRRTVFVPRNPAQGAFEIHQVPLATGKGERVAFNFSVKVDHRGEWEQLFEESWRVMRHRFYDPDMHGRDWRDWEAIRSEYKPLLAHVGTYEDAYDLANQMIGELNASHVGVSGPSSVNMPTQYRTRFPGVELEPAGERYRISHVYRDGPARKEWLDLKVGDYLLAVDGEEVRAGDNYWKVFNHLLNEYVTLRVADSPGGARAREVRVRTVASLQDIKYEEWVEGNREFVERESGGRIAYVHIRSMNQPSLARFRNEIDRFWAAEGIVVDIRYNGGGNIDQELLDILERRPYQYWNSRWGARSWGRRPRQAIAGPKVMLINHRSGSDSEVTPMGFRDLGLGRIVGHPTSGAVIATGSYRLINGGSIRTPGSLVVTYDPTQPHNFGINLENYGVAPDVWVQNTPEDELRGFDRELKAAVDEALRMLGEGLWQYKNLPGGEG